MGLKKNLENSKLSEEMEKVDLEAAEWEVEKLFETKKFEGLGWRNIFRYEELKEFLQGTKKENIIEELLIKFQELIANKKRLPDFICKKNGEVKFIEVKNCKHFKNPYDIKQQKAIEEIWNCFNIETELTNLTIDKEQTDKFLEDYCEKTGNEVVEFEIKEEEEGKLSLNIIKGSKIKENDE